MAMEWDDVSLQDSLDLQKRVGVMDLHVDSIIQQRLFGYDINKPHKPGLKGQPLFWHADIPRLREGGFGSICMGIHYWPWESEGGIKEMSKQIDYLDFVAQHNPYCMRVWNPEQWDEAKEKGLLGMAPGVEGAHMLNGKIGRVKLLAQKGVSYLTLAHFSKNSAATPSLGRGRNEKDGLTDFGREVVRELNRYGIVIDVAHVNTPGVLEVCRETKAPIMCTHTGVKGVHPHDRNITDEEIDGIADLGGCIGIMFSPGFLAGTYGGGSELAADHLDYVVQRVGIDYASIGSDYDGWLPSILDDHRDCRDMVKLTDLLRRRGYSDDDLEKVLRTNAIRVFKDAYAKRDLEACKGVRP